MRWQRDKTGKTALMWAKANGHTDILTILEKLEAEDEAYWTKRLSEHASLKV
jgi:ankyrin repeat protein